MSWMMASNLPSSHRCSLFSTCRLMSADQCSLGNTRGYRPGNIEAALSSITALRLLPSSWCRWIQQLFPPFLGVVGIACVGWPLHGCSTIAIAHPPQFHHVCANHHCNESSNHTSPSVYDWKQLIVGLQGPMPSLDTGGFHASSSARVVSVTCFMTLPSSGSSSAVPPLSAKVTRPSPSSAS